MKKGFIAILLIGIVLLIFLYLSPVVPLAKLETAKAEEESEQIQPTTEEAIEQALEELKSGVTPPMQGILKIRKVAEDYPNNIKANYILGILSMQTAQYDKAISRFETVIKNSPDNIEAHRFLAQALLNTGDTVAAQKTYEKAMLLADEVPKAEIEEEISKLNINKKFEDYAERKEKEKA